MNTVITWSINRSMPRKGGPTRFGAVSKECAWCEASYGRVQRKSARWPLDALAVAGL